MTAGKIAYKADASPVTEIDHAINASLKSSLTAMLPQAGWLSEEDADDLSRLDAEYVWIIDPLDGTREMLAGIPEWAITVGLAYNGVAVMGGVVNPATGEGGAWSKWHGGLYWGWTEPAAAAADLAAARIIISRREMKKGLYDSVADNLAGLRAVGSAAYKLLRVAAGRDDIYLSITPKSEWDLCGGIALLEGAGKIYRRFDGGENKFNQPDILWRGGGIGGDAALVAKLEVMLSKI